jgi:hypothetical protein
VDTNNKKIVELEKNEDGVTQDARFFVDYEFTAIDSFSLFIKIGL